jgi:hypothetical protein
MTAFRVYLASFRARPNEDDAEVWKDREKAIIRLLTAIGAELGYKLEQLDLMGEAYAPQGWRTEAEKQAAVRDMFHEIATGKRAFPVLGLVPELFVETLGENRGAVRVSVSPMAEPARHGERDPSPPPKLR